MSKKMKYLTESERREFYQVVSSDQGKNAERNYVLFLVGEYFALRVSELINLQIADYNFDYHCLYCKRSKNGNSNTIVIIDPFILKKFEDYLRGTSGKYIFKGRNQESHISRQQVDHITKQYFSLTRIPEDKHHFHVFRHTRAVELGNAGVDVKDIQWWLGHKNISNTLIYLQFTFSQQKRLYDYLKSKISERLDYEENSETY